MLGLLDIPTYNFSGSYTTQICNCTNDSTGCPPNQTHFKLQIFKTCVGTLIRGRHAYIISVTHERRANSSKTTHLNRT